MQTLIFPNETICPVVYSIEIAGNLFEIKQFTNTEAQNIEEGKDCLLYINGDIYAENFIIAAAKKIAEKGNDPNNIWRSVTMNRFLCNKIIYNYV